jgi:hypothetical protein
VIVLATAGSVAIDAMAGFGALCAASIILAAIWAALFRRHREHHKNTRGYL